MDIKKFICDAIEKQKNEVVKKYDSRIGEISNEDNLARIYYLISETFHNTVEQGEIQIEFLKQVLTNDFFKTAVIDNGVNYIYFSNEDFDVLFSKCLIKEIKIIFKKPGGYHYNYLKVNENKINLANLIEQFLNNKSFKTFKALVDFNCRNRSKDLASVLPNYIRTYRKCNQQLLNNIREEEARCELKEIEIQKKNEKYYERQIYAKEFIESLTDLRVFKDEGWRISIDGIKNDYLTI